MRLTTRLGLAAAAALAAAAESAPAAAHPLGDPQTVRLSADGDQVTAVWAAPPDDLLVLGSVTGVLTDRREYVFDLNPDGEPEPVGDSDAELLRSSDAVADYLAAKVTVTQDGRACPAEVDLSGLVDDGAELVFSCEAEVSEVTITVTALTDADPAYRTVAFAEGADRDQLLYSLDSPSADWRFDAGAADPAASAAGPGWTVFAVIGTVAAVVAAAVAFGLRRLRRAAEA
jgi:hypothetical protein